MRQVYLNTQSSHHHHTRSHRNENDLDEGVINSSKEMSMDSEQEIKEIPPATDADRSFIDNDNSEQQSSDESFHPSSSQSSSLEEEIDDDENFRRIRSKSRPRSILSHSAKYCLADGTYTESFGVAPSASLPPSSSSSSSSSSSCVLSPRTTASMRNTASASTVFAQSHSQSSSSSSSLTSNKPKDDRRSNSNDKNRITNTIRTNDNKYNNNNKYNSSTTNINTTNYNNERQHGRSSYHHSNNNNYNNNTIQVVVTVIMTRIALIHVPILPPTHHVIIPLLTRNAVVAMITVVMITPTPPTITINPIGVVHLSAILIIIMIRLGTLTDLSQPTILQEMLLLARHSLNLSLI